MQQYTYQSIFVRKHHTYKGHTKFTKSSRWAGIRTFPVSTKSYSWILFKHQKRSKPSCNLPRFTQRYFRVLSAQVLNTSCIYCELSNLFKKTMYPRLPRLLQYAYLKMADGHVALWSICHYAFPWWTNGAWALETVETKSMKGTISHFSTWHDGILEQYIRCGVHQSAITFDQFHSFRILEEKLW